MALLDNVKQAIAALLPDNITKDISAAKMRAAFSTALDWVQNVNQFVAPTEVWKTVTATTGRERSFSITLDSPGNTIGELAITSVSNRVLKKGVHFTISGAGSSRTLNISDPNFDSLSPGEQLHYRENGKGDSVGLVYPIVKIVNEAGVAKLKWRWPAETDADLRYIADMPIPSPYKTTDIQHLDPTYGNRPLSTVLASLNFQPTNIDQNTDWSTLAEGTYGFAVSSWLTGKNAPEKLYGYGIARVFRWGATGFVIQAFPHIQQNNYSFATLVRYPGADLIYSKWQYTTHLSETLNRFSRILIGTQADSGEDLNVNGPMKLNGAQFGVTSLSKTMAYVPGAWCNSGFRGWGPGGDLPAQNSAYLFEIAFDPAGVAGISSGLYSFRAVGMISASIANNQAQVGGVNVTVPIVLNQMAHAFNSRTVELRWEIYNYAGGAPNLQVRISGDTAAVAGNVPVYVKLRQIFI